MNKWLILLVVSLVVLSVTQVHGQSSQASELMGRVVVTGNGELLGRVEDFALDLAAGEVKFVVVSVGSYLIDDNLVAVDPDALSPSADGQYLVVNSDDLATARRFSQGNWPDAPDVLATSGAGSTVSGDNNDAATAAVAEAGPGSKRTAVISDGRRTATMKSGDRQAQIETSPEAVVAGDSSLSPKKYQVLRSQDDAAADPEFRRLDANKDGYLSRREIGPVLGMGDAYPDFDVDGNEGIDAFEYQVFKNRG